MSFNKFLKTGKVPVSAQFINAQTNKAPVMKPHKAPQTFKGKDREDVERWLIFCAIATTMLDTGTKGLKNKGVLHSRNAIFDLIASFKQLSDAFGENKEFLSLQNDVDNFIYTFLTLKPEEQNRVVKFQESIINKNYKNE